MARENWTREQLIEVLKLYCSTPFGKIHSRNPEIISLAAVISRTPSAVAMKMANFASLDPTVSQKGMSKSSALDKSLWDEFFANTDDFLKNEKETPLGFGETQVILEEYESRVGIDRVVLSKSRTNQPFFRRMILASYEERCAVTGIVETDLLLASHIIPWAINSATRLNPCNGICLNSLHDRAFDSGLISVAEDMRILYSRCLSTETLSQLKELGGEKLRKPSRFHPNPEFLAYHRNNIFQQ